MSDDLKDCPNCGAKLNPTFTTNMLVDQSYVRIINLANGSNLTHAYMKSNEPA